MKKIKPFFAIITSFILTILPLSIFAETTTITTFPYFDGFEDPALDATWTFVNGSSVNKWYIGTTQAANNADAAEGTRSLYVSGDGGATASYQNFGTGVGAYKEFEFPSDYTRYEISFDWKMGGEVNQSGDTLDGFHVFWIPDPDAPITTGGYPDGLKSFEVKFANLDLMQGADFWHNATLKNTFRAGASGRLLFYWVNNQINSNPPAVCIDNIQIYPAKGYATCEKPSDLKLVQDGGLKFTWQGNSDFYRLKYKNETTGEWTEVAENIPEKYYTFYGLKKGFYTFWVSGVCGTDTTTWAVYSNYLQAVSMDKCFNYADLTSASVQAAYGNYGEGATAHNGLIDFGPGSNASRHTIHYDKKERDPFSGGKLRTVPEGEVATVRLGNWHGGSEAESLTYTFTVDRNNPILLIKYAALMQFHSNEEAIAPPRFIIQLKDARDIPLDGQCFAVDYTSSENLDKLGWNKNESYPQAGSGSPVMWKDWTTMGMNLSAYAGRTLKLYISTRDCGPVPSGDDSCFAYAYFSLDCAAANFEGLSCGDKAEEIESVCAPAGFRYSWYNVADPQVEVSDDQCYTPKAGDKSTYKCRMSFVDLGRESCDFELTASLLPRYPAADASYYVCRREVQLFDKSYVYTKAGSDTELIDELCDIYWVLGDTVKGDTIMYDRNPVYEFAKPGKYEVKLFASINRGECEEVWFDSITVSNDTLKYEFIHEMCAGEFYTFGTSVLLNSGIYTDTLITHYGCDSIAILDLKVHGFAYDTVCGSQIYKLRDGDELREFTLKDGRNDLLYQNVKSKYNNCDSIMRVQVIGDIEFEPEKPICADANEFLFYITGGNPQSVEIEFDQNDVFTNAFETIGTDKTFRIMLPEVVRPGVYSGKFIFESPSCAPTEKDFSFTVLYPDSIVGQRWNNLLFVRNSDFNGGFDFDTYQWYVGEDTIQGATNSYLHIPEGLDMAAGYRVELTRASDKISLFTCPVIPKEIGADKVSLELITTPVVEGETVQFTSEKNGLARIYHISGMLQSEQVVVEGKNTLRAPSRQGSYLLRIQLEDKTVKTYHLQK